MQPYLIVAGDFVKTGGMDRANFALADYLARQNKELHLVAYRVDRVLLNHPNIVFHKVPKLLNSYFISGFLLRSIANYWAKKITNRGGRVIANGGNCISLDVNWIHYLHIAYDPLRKDNLLGRFKTKLAHKSYIKDESFALRSAKIIIANSARTANDIINKTGLEKDTIRVIYYGIDPSLFRPADLEEKIALKNKSGLALDKPLGIFIGALSDRRKGFDVLFKAWYNLCQDKSWDVNLLVVGSGAELDFWKNKSSAAGLSNRISFLGFRRDIPDLLRLADCLIAPSRYEAYGLGVQEAICCGIPAIIGQNAGIAERYPDNLKELLLDDPQDALSLEKHLLEWRKDMDGYCKRALGFSTVLREYSWDRMAGDILKTIGEEVS
jgi:glycosyltransferase involved in cell wall biosynthesis